MLFFEKIVCFRLFLFKKHISKIIGKQVADFLPRYFDHECRSPTQKCFFLLHRIHIFSPTREICHVSYTGNTISPAQEIPSLSQHSHFQSFSLHRPCGHRIARNKLGECILEMTEGVLKPPLCLEVLAKEPP